MMECECFDFSPFGLDVQVVDSLDFLHCHDPIHAVEDFKHFLPVFSKVAIDIAEGLKKWRGAPRLETRECL